jgi:hypothetical protein
LAIERRGRKPGEKEGKEKIRKLQETGALHGDEMAATRFWRVPRFAGLYVCTGLRACALTS